jgi:hypothetical protein
VFGVSPTINPNIIFIVFIQSLRFTEAYPYGFKMSSLEAANLFSVKSMVFVITGGGTGTPN